MAERNSAHAAVVDERLGIRPVDAAGRRVAGVTDRDLARQRLQLLLVEDLSDEAHVAEHGQSPTFGDGDPCRLLAAVLEREEREVGEPRHVAVVGANSEDAAHLVLTLPGGAEVGERDAENLVPADLADPPYRDIGAERVGLDLARTAWRGSPGRSPRRRA